MTFEPVLPLLEGRLVLSPMLLISRWYQLTVLPRHPPQALKQVLSLLIVKSPPPLHRCSLRNRRLQQAPTLLLAFSTFHLLMTHDQPPPSAASLVVR